MTRQQEIREGVARRIHIVEKQLLRVVEETSPCNCTWEELPGYFKEQYYKEADRTLCYLQSQGVVILKDMGDDMAIKDDFKAVEPLIEKK